MTTGERLQVGDRGSEWQGWVWCTSSDGESRWVPEAFVERHGEYCLALRNYESTELNVQEGDTLLIMEIESGWGWCTSTDGHNGWVPLSCVEFDHV